MRLFLIQRIAITQLYRKIEGVNLLPFKWYSWPKVSLYWNSALVKPSSCPFIDTNDRPESKITPRNWRIIWSLFREICHVLTLQKKYRRAYKKKKDWSSSKFSDPSLDPSCSRRLRSLSFGEFEKKEKERKCKPGDYTIQGSLWEFRLEDEKRCGVKKKGMKKKRGNYKDVYFARIVICIK